MAITYHAGRRIQGLDAEGFSSGTMSATGGTVSTNTSVTPNRKIHTFTSSGNFVVTGNATDVQYLVIGGGGGGTANGGGGAGAYRESGVSTGDSAISLTEGTYTITVGAGGSGNDSGSPSGNNDGSSSIFSSITSEGGGSGGQQNGGAGGACSIGGSNNGSGGGGGGESSGGACAGGASGAYGNAGGSGNATSPAGAGGGGGGAGSAGTNATNSLAGGNGGNGLASSITGSSVTRAGGGGGGTWQTSGEGSGGSGGGGEGLNRSGGGGTTHATANTGSGGGGKWDSGSAGNGGSGIVIISYVPDQSYSINNISNAELGSRYEATDTRKIYYYADPLSVDDDLSTDKGWVSNTSDWTYNATGDYIDFATIRRSQTAQQIYIDLQDSDYLGSGNNLSDSKWVFRCKLTIGSLASSGNVLMYVGFTDNLNDSGAIPQHGAMIMLNTSPTENGLQSAISTRNFETSSSPDRINGTIYSSGNLPASSVRYMEMKRDGAVFTLKAFTDSSFSTQAGSTATVTKTGTALTGLRYLKAFNDSEQNGSTSTGTRLDEIKIYNGATSTDTAWSELG